MGESFDTLHVAFASEFLPISSNISMNSYRRAQNSIILEQSFFFERSIIHISRDA